MDWFEKLTDFRETDYEDTRAKLSVEGSRLHSLVNGKNYGIGSLELVPLQTLRERARAAGGLPGRPKIRVVMGDVREMHRLPANAGALFQVASQFNLLEMVSPTVTPEQGVTRYQHDHTQGPACAIAAGAATIYRNYFVPVGGSFGQTTERQIDALADIGVVLSDALDRPVNDLWKMQNGYALCTQSGLQAIAGYLRTLEPDQSDVVRGKLCIGIHRDIEVTDTARETGPRVSQAFCSALPVAYSQVARSYWEPFAKLVLDAAYEATMWAAVLNAQRGASSRVLLTLLGGGAFGNEERWIHTAMRRALKMTSEFELDVSIVSYGKPSRAITEMAENFGPLGGAP
jgi:hypothetical protein